MTVLIVLFASWPVFLGIGALGVSALATWHGSACYALACSSSPESGMVPAFFPRPMLLVYFTGILEFMGVAGLHLARFRSLAGICLIALLIAIFPPNVNAALKGTTLRVKPPTLLWLRPPMQLLFIGLLCWSHTPLAVNGTSFLFGGE